MRSLGVREGEEPSTRSGDAVEAEVSQAVALSGRGIEKVVASVGFDLGRQALLRRGVGGLIDVGVGEEGGEERGLGVGGLKTAVNVIFVEARPDTCTELLGLSQTGNISGRCVFYCAAGSDTTGCHAEADQPPVLIRQRASHEATKGMADVAVSVAKARSLERRGHGMSTRFWPILCKSA